MPAVAEAPRRAVTRSKAPRKLHVVPEKGFQQPRLAPPLPDRSLVTELRKAAKLAEHRLFPWQELTGQYMTALSGGRWLFPEIAILVGRQNGKSKLLVSRIVMGLLRGERIMHTAQDRSLPRIIYTEVAEIIQQRLKSEAKGSPRFANGTEEIRMHNGGSYRIVSPNRNGARGPSNDLVIVDEARELVDYDFVAAAEPTLTASKNPQIIYLSSAGWDGSVVLNSLRNRAESDKRLGYLEWSAAPERAVDDRLGWREANPRLDVKAEAHIWDYIERQYEKHRADGTLHIFEVEHLTRWVRAMLPGVTSDMAWNKARGELSEPARPAMGISVDPLSRRISAVLAWIGPDALVHLHNVADFHGDPVDLDRCANGAADEQGVLELVRKLRIKDIAFDPWTDRDFARYFKDAKPLMGAEYEAACVRFKQALEGGQLRHDDTGELTADISHTVRKDTPHGWVAIPASADRATTASIAAIRAVWLATAPTAKKPQVF